MCSQVEVHMGQPASQQSFKAPKRYHSVYFQIKRNGGPTPAGHWHSNFVAVEASLNCDDSAPCIMLPCLCTIILDMSAW
jgi:hypothetical protein